MEIKIVSHYGGSGGVDLYIWQQIGQKIYCAKEMKIEFVECPEGIAPGASLRLAHFSAETFFKAMAEAIDKQGVKTENDFKIQGKLEATQGHLQDLRQLLKLK